LKRRRYASAKKGTFDKLFEATSRRLDETAGSQPQELAAKP
jgi:hypothetical protein